MSSQTFKAGVALTSWVHTPFLPTRTRCTASILEEANLPNIMERERAKRSIMSRIILISTVIEVARSTFFFVANYIIYYGLRTVTTLRLASYPVYIPFASLM